MARSGSGAKRRPLTINFDGERVPVRQLDEETLELVQRSRALQIDPSDERPLLLLDIDGALCPDVSEREGFLSRKAGTVSVLVGGQHAHWLEGLATRFQLVWATLWEHLANAHVAPLFGLPLLPVIEFPALANDGEWDEERGRFVSATTDKLPAIIAAAGERPFAWVDDDIKEDALAWAETRSRRGIPTLFLRTDSSCGLTSGEVAQLHAFAAFCAGETGS